MNLSRLPYKIFIWQVLVATNWTDLKPDLVSGSEVILGAWGLLPDSDYILSIRATNEKGESNPIYVGGSTHISAISGQDGDATWLPINDHKTESMGSRMPLLFVIVGILVTLMIMGALLTAILAVRRRKLAKLSQIEVQSTGGSGSSSAVSSNQTPPHLGKLIATQWEISQLNFIISRIVLWFSLINEQVELI